MATIDVDTTYTLDAPRATHFFNGRLLSAEDLTRERDATRLLLERLGKACGEGVAYGLEVTAATPKDDPRPCLSISPGLAINRRGRTVELRSPVTVALLPAGGRAGAGAAAKKRAASAGEFCGCETLAGSYLATRGVYLFMVRPAEGRDGTAPASGLGNIDSACTAATIVDGLVFHYERLEEPELPAEVLADEARLRNRVAHLCFGSGDARRGSWVRDPFRERSETYGLLDDLRGTKLQSCDVPLALFYWKEGKPGAPGHVEWVDLWSVRRRPARVAFGGPLTPAIVDRRQAEGEAMILQFQEEVAGWSPEARRAAVATTRFARLPPIGILPLAGGAYPGIEESTFFEGVKLRPGPAARLEGAGLPHLLASAVAYPPIVLGDEPAAREVVWRYQVRENLLVTPGAPHPAPYLVFASGHLAYQGNGRADVSRWDYAQYAIV